MISNSYNQYKGQQKIKHIMKPALNGGLAGEKIVLGQQIKNSMSQQPGLNISGIENNHS
jgi:hypothetical protein